MDLKKKMRLIEEMLEVEKGSLNSETLLEDIEEWDSMAALSLIVLLEENFNKIILGKEIRALKTVGDILKTMV